MMGEKITREHFIRATGREPIDDDLDRCNCDKAGELAHSCCGWHEELDRPWFDAPPSEIRARRPTAAAYSDAELAGGR